MAPETLDMRCAKSHRAGREGTNRRKFRPAKIRDRRASDIAQTGGREGRNEMERRKPLGRPLTGVTAAPAGRLKGRGDDNEHGAGAWSSDGPRAPGAAPTPALATGSAPAQRSSRSTGAALDARPALSTGSAPALRSSSSTGAALKGSLRVSEPFGGKCWWQSPPRDARASVNQRLRWRPRRNATGSQKRSQVGGEIGGR